MDIFDQFAENIFRRGRKFQKSEMLKAFLDHNLDFFDLLTIEDQDKMVNAGNFYSYFKKTEGINANLQLIGMFSIIESINSKEEYIEFKEWCNQKRNSIDITSFQSFSELLEYLKKEYHELHGSTQKTLSFFEKYLKDEEKTFLSQKVRVNLSEEEPDGKAIEFRKCVRLLYEMRNDFIHNARFMPIHKEGEIIGLVKERYVRVNFTMPELLSLFEKAFIRFFREKVNQESTPQNVP